MAVEGEGTPGWIAGLPADLQGNETFVQFKTVGDFAKHHLDVAKTHTESETKIKDLEGKMGNAVFIPGNNATDEERTTFSRSSDGPTRPRITSSRL